MAEGKSPFRKVLGVTATCGAITMLCGFVGAQVGNPTFCFFQYDLNCAARFADTSRHCYPGGVAVACPDVIAVDSVYTTYPNVRSVGIDETGCTEAEQTDLIEVTILFKRCDENQTCQPVGEEDRHCQGWELDWEAGEECSGESST